MTLITGHLDSENNMWSGYLDIVDEYDKRLTERWKEDTKGVLVFVSFMYRSQCPPYNDPRDRSFFLYCRILHHPKLPTLVSQHW